MSRVETTIILITDSKVTRADFAGRNASRQVHFAQEKRAVGTTFEQVLETALAKPKQVGQKTLILDTAIWSQLVSLPRLSVMDVNEDDLENALKFEVETLSGIDADQAVLGTRSISTPGNTDQSKTFWVNVATKDEVELSRRLLKPRGAKWIGLAHPAGMNLVNFPENRNSTKRHQIELWDNLVALLEKSDIQSIASRSGHWHNQFGFDSLTELRESSNVMAESTDLVPDELMDCEPVVLDNDSTLSKWMHAAARRTARQELNEFPAIVGVQVQPSYLQQGVIRRVALATLIGIFCFVHYSFLRNQYKSAESQMIQVKQPAIEKRNYDSQLNQVLNERSKLEQDAAKVQIQFKQIEFLFKYQTGRLERLLDLLVRTRTSDLVIGEIAPHEKGIVVKGVSLGGNSAPLMANQLRELAIPLGWRIHAPTQIGEQKMISGGPWEFSILFEDVGPGQAPAVEIQLPSNNEVANEGTSF